MMAVVMVTSMSAILVTAASPESPRSKAILKMEPELRTQVMESLAGPSKAALRTIVFLDDSADVVSSGKAIARAGADVKQEFGGLGAFSVDMDGKAALEVAMLGQVERIFLDEYKYRLLDATEVPGARARAELVSQDADLEPGDLWWATTSAVMGAEDVWTQGVDGSGVLVAVLDTGCDITQGDLDGAVHAYKSFTSEEFHDVDGHGTATAGLVASRGVNEYDFTALYGVTMKMMGMAPGSMVMTGKVLDDTGYGWDSWIIGGIEWAVEEGADIISMSLGGMEVPNDGNDPTSEALDRAYEQGIISFLASGNEGTGQSTVGASGVSKTTMTVGGTTLNAECQLIKYWPLSNYDETELIVKEGEEGYENDHMIWFSSRGPTADGRIDPDISAVGAWGPSLQPADTLEIQFGGTSMATPVAAGIAALIIQAFDDVNGRAPTPDEIRAIMMGTALDTGYGPNEQGPGRVDALAAYNAVMSGWTGSGQTSVALTIPMGGSETVEFAEGAVLSSKAIVPSETEGIYKMDEYCPIATDLFYEFTVPEGDDYITVDLAFDQKYLFKKDIYRLTNPAGYTDTHLNVIVYRLDEYGERTMINYAYAHANTQELNVRVTPGEYELRVSPVIYAAPGVPFDLGIEFYKTVEWDWFSAEGNVATITVPEDAMAGLHTAFIETSYEGVCSLVPVAVSVPIEMEVPIAGVMDVGHEVYYYAEGDWNYYFMEVPEDDTPPAITAVVDWASPGTDIDSYWINPATRVVEASLTEYVGNGMFGPWETSTMDTADVLTVLDPEPGMWMFALHVVLMDRVLKEPYTLTVYPFSAAEFEDDSLTVRPGRPVTTTLANNVDQRVGVGLMPVLSTPSVTTVEYEDMVSSIDQHGTGAIEILFDVAPLTQSIALSIAWEDEAADIDVVVYSADWSNAGILWENGDSMTVDNPVMGEWAAIVALKNSARQVSFLLTLETTAYEPWSALTLSTTSVWLEPGSSADVTVSLKGPKASAQGMILAYDLVTGCEYDAIQVSRA